MTPHPTTISDLEKELMIHAKDGRSDALFRMSIALSQLGSLAAHLTHDQTLNPGSRPYGSRAGEISDAGHAILQVMTYCILRDISLQEAINEALSNLREKDFLSCKDSDSCALPNVDETKPICNGKSKTPVSIYGTAFVDPTGCHISEIPDGAIFVTRHIDTRHIPYLNKVSAVITDHGGNFSHAAIVCRELEIPYLVGCVTATTVIRSGDDIRMYSDGVEGAVFKVKFPIEVGEPK